MGGSSFLLSVTQRRAATATASSFRSLVPVVSNGQETAHPPNTLAGGHHPFIIRPLSAAAATSAKSRANSGHLSYNERKAAAKQLRRETWDRHQQRLERLKTRRDNSPKDVKKTVFRSWWDKEMEYHNKLRRTAKQEGKPWRIRVAVMVERPNVVMPDYEDYELEWMDLKNYLMSYGKQYPDETKFMFEPDKPEDHIIESDEDMLAGLPFVPAPRETEADASGNVKTLDRQLKTKVFLAVKSGAEGNRNGPRWTLPSAIPQEDETLLQTAERAVSEAVGEDLQLWLPSNAPMTINYRVYNKNMAEDFRGNYFGEKIFFYRLQYDSGDVDEEAMTADDYGWLTREEVVDRITDERGRHQAKFYHYML